jgi:KUP system potassium uptake protein
MDAERAQPRSTLPLLALGALGVVYGDIGTSPLYTIKEIFVGPHPLAVTPDNVLGILSLVFWSLVLVVTVKYLIFVMEADNEGEGGIVAMLALVQRATALRPGMRRALAALGIFGAALFYGDSLITPAISVLSAVEGIGVATPAFDRFEEPIAVAILVLLFAFQRHGTHKVGRLFGPIMALWFSVLAIAGLIEIRREPEVLLALNPLYGLQFFLTHGWGSMLVLGSVVLAVTGAEALYADMGHFGKAPIRWAWLALVLPSLTLNYFGQGALLIRDPAAIDNPFYLMLPRWGLYPMVALATAATVIASQAVISGAYSMTRQAILLGYLPRMSIRYTSEREMGQVYMPFVNWALLAGVLALVLGFRTSAGLAAAYGVAVTGTMAITTVLGFLVATRLWNRSPVAASLGLVVFLGVDLAFLGANLIKIPDGGWFPLAVGAILLAVMTTWKKGRRVMEEHTHQDEVPLEPFLDALMKEPPVRVPGIAVFLSSDPDRIPRALLHNLNHNKVMHETNLFVTVRTRDVPQVPGEGRIEARKVAPGCFRVLVHYGFMQTPNIPRALGRCDLWPQPLNLMQTSFFMSRETPVLSRAPSLSAWRLRLFALMLRSAQSAMGFFHIPPNRVIELGCQVKL